jgi:hypothetical protein
MVSRFLRPSEHPAFVESSVGDTRSPSSVHFSSSSTVTLSSFGRSLRGFARPLAPFIMAIELIATLVFHHVVVVGVVAHLLTSSVNSGAWYPRSELQGA